MSRNKKFNFPIGIAVFLTLVGYVFKVQHWPYGFSIDIIGQIGIGIFYLFRYFWKTNKNVKDNFKLVLVISFVLGNVLVLPYVFLFYFRYFILLMGLICMVLEIKGLVNKNNDQLNTLLYIGSILIFIEIVCRMMWWPGASVLHLFALLMVSLGFISESFNKKV